MKKLLAILSAVLIIVCVFAGCSSADNETDVTIPEGQVATDSAKITGSDAIHYIQDSYTAQELGLDNVAHEYTFMVKTNGYIYEGENYVRVDANIVTENEGVTSEDGKQTYSMEIVGEYLISFDGNTVLMRDMDAEGDVYTELDNRIADYSAKAENASTTVAEETTAQ